MEKRVYTLGELARLVGGRLAGGGGVEISGVSGIREAGPGDITMVSGAHYAEYLASTRAAAVVRTAETESALPSIVVDKPHLAYAKLLELFASPTDAEADEGIHPSAVVDPTAEVASDVRIGPYCFVGRGSRIGAGTRILFGVFIGDRVAIGRQCLVFPNVTIREASEIGDRVILHPGVVIGADGFGFIWDGERQVKIPQIGKVVIEDDVEIGANSAVDRATTDVTRIGRGTKIDNLVQVGHNCVIGAHSILAGQVGVAGSTDIGERVTVGGQSGFTGHIKIGDCVTVAARSGVTKDTRPGLTVSGYPARDHRMVRRLWAYTERLPELFERLKRLEARLADGKKETAHGEAAEDDC